MLRLFCVKKLLLILVFEIFILVLIIYSLPKMFHDYTWQDSEIDFKNSDQLELVYSERNNSIIWTHPWTMLIQPLEKLAFAKKRPGMITEWESPDLGKYIFHGITWVTNEGLSKIIEESETYFIECRTARFIQPDSNFIQDPSTFDRLDWRNANTNRFLATTVSELCSDEIADSTKKVSIYDDSPEGRDAGKEASFGFQVLYLNLYESKNGNYPKSLDDLPENIEHKKRDDLPKNIKPLNYIYLSKNSDAALGLELEVPTAKGQTRVLCWQSTTGLTNSKKNCSI